MLLLKSIIIGILAIFPGVSGSAMAISFGLYDNFFRSLRNIKSNKLFLFLFSVGLLIGIYFGSNLLIYLINFKTILYYFLIGIILSDVIIIIKKIKKTGKILYLWSVISFLLSLSTNFIIKINDQNSFNFFKMLIGGFLFAFGKIFPGISSSFFLISLGIYKDILIILTNPIIIISNPLKYLPFFIGFLVGLVIFIKLLNYMMDNKYNLLYSIIIGFIISSIFVLIPKFNFDAQNIVGIILMITSFIFSMKIKVKKEM